MSNNYVEEAGRLIKLIDTNQLKEKDYLFVESIRSKVKFNSYVSEKAIFWLRDIKDRQLESA